MICLSTPSIGRTFCQKAMPNGAHPLTENAKLRKIHVK